MTQRFGWGHININVSNLENAIQFYEKLGFSVFIPGIPYLGLKAHSVAPIAQDAAAALGLPKETRGRACIMQLDDGFPKIDLTELPELSQQSPLSNADLGVVRICLVSENLQADYEYLTQQGVEFISPPHTCHERLAEVATCKDPDGTLIELLQVYLEKWGPFLAGESNG